MRFITSHFTFVTYSPSNIIRSHASEFLVYAATHARPTVSSAAIDSLSNMVLFCWFIPSAFLISTSILSESSFRFFARCQLCYCFFFYRFMFLSFFLLYKFHSIFTHFIFNHCNYYFSNYYRCYYLYTYCNNNYNYCDYDY